MLNQGSMVLDKHTLAATRQLFHHKTCCCTTRGMIKIVIIHIYVNTTDKNLPRNILNLAEYNNWHMTCLRHAPASIAAAEKRPLSYQMPQSVHMDTWFETVVLRPCYWQCIMGVKKLGENRGRNGQILTPNERILTFGVPVYGVKFPQNWVRIATVREVTDRRTDRHTDVGEFIICPMLCYSNGTDNDVSSVVAFFTVRRYA